MKILLIGEFSRLHNSLKEGLNYLGHDVIIIGSGDLFKKLPVDIDVSVKFFNNSLGRFLRKITFRVFGFDIADLETFLRVKKNLHQLKGFDIVQLINEDAFNLNPGLQKLILKPIFKHNKFVFLLSCGDDYTSTNYHLNNKDRYSVLTPYFKDSKLKKKFQYSLKFTTKPYKKLHDFIVANCNGVIASDMDYHIPLLEHPKYLGLIPNPINIKKIKFSPIKANNKINIFLGINTLSRIKKGIPFFEEALNIIQKKYPEKVDIKITKNLPYNEYINIYNNAHIVLDQVYAYDQGYNALEAMAKGKVIFTGAEKEWLNHYDLKEDTVAINALPDVNQIVKKLEWLIQNPKKIEDISKNARSFIEKEHHYITIAQLYLDTWKNH
ncbi:glycosyltransferase [Mangrovimonas cancribranchiae]|uniref:Glycosyltransferase n=1 Tax=Mangrovimonas cancribranchiae TaxID=3080055 RepID=A0AAU6NYG7_9FLAO